MEEVELVIKIPKALYIKGFEEVFSEEERKELIRAIGNGIPFPKKHGRIGDLDALETEMINGIKAGNYEDGYENYSHINDMDDCIECVRYADTIIKANKEGGDESRRTN